MRSIATPARRLALVASLSALLWSPAAAADGTTATTPRPDPLVVRVEDGFRWSDAGVGAAAGFGGGLVLAGSLALAGRRHRSPSHMPHLEEDHR
jgi:hypothetical protein